MAILKSKVQEENIGRARANFHALLENVGHFDNDSVLRHIWCHICLRADYVRVTHRARNHNTPLKNEEQVSVTFEFGILKNNSS